MTKLTEDETKFLRRRYWAVTDVLLRRDNSPDLGPLRAVASRDLDLLLKNNGFKFMGGGR